MPETESIASGEFDDEILPFDEALAGSYEIREVFGVGCRAELVDRT